MAAHFDTRQRFLPLKQLQVFSTGWYWIRYCLGTGLTSSPLLDLATHENQSDTPSLDVSLGEIA